MSLDHLVLLVPTLSSPFFTNAGFTLLPGGTHADGLTSNSLLVLPDGIYIEVIAFSPSAPLAAKDTHWWGRKSFGWIDWSLGPAPRTAAQRVKAGNEAAGKKIFEEPVRGGRKTVEGRELEWAVAFPVVDREAGEERGVLPFWCEDVTERGRRVPSRQAPHPNGAKGVKALTLLSNPAGLANYVSSLAAVLNSAAPGTTYQFELVSPVGGKIAVVVREPASAEERRWVEERGEGLWEVELEGGKGAKIGGGEGARIVLGGERKTAEKL